MRPLDLYSCVGNVMQMLFMKRGGGKGWRILCNLVNPMARFSENSSKIKLSFEKKCFEISLLKNLDSYKQIRQGHPVKNYNTSCIITQRRSYVLEGEKSFCY